MPRPNSAPQEPPQDSTSSGTDATAMAALRAAISNRLAAQTAFDQISVAARSNAALELLPAHLIGDDLSQLVAAYAATNGRGRAPDVEQSGETVDRGRFAAGTGRLGDGTTGRDRRACRHPRWRRRNLCGGCGGPARLGKRSAHSIATCLKPTQPPICGPRNNRPFRRSMRRSLHRLSPPEAATGIGGKKLMAIALLVGMTPWRGDGRAIR